MRPIEKPSGSHADKFSAVSYLEITPMNSTQTAQEQQPATLTALQQTLREMFTSSGKERVVGSRASDKCTALGKVFWAIRTDVGTA